MATDDAPGRAQGAPESADALQERGVGALWELEAASKRMQDVYTHLQEQYRTLKQKYDKKVTSIVSEHQAGSNGYVVVLIDAHSHRFKENLLRGASSGGAAVARSLRRAAIEHLDQMGLQISHTNIHIRAYANVKGLSIDVEGTAVNYKRADGVGKPKAMRTLGDFVTGFNSEDVLITLVDVPSDQIVVKMVCESFRSHIENPLCQQIFLGAGGGSAYSQVLTAHASLTQNITVISRSDGDNSLARFGFKTAMFPTVFDPIDHLTTKDTVVVMIPATKQQHSPYVPPYLRSSMKRSTLARQQDIGASPSPPTAPMIEQSNTQILLNAVGARVDMKSNAPSAQDWALFNSRSKRKSLCFSFHLAGQCNMGATCAYDHDTVSVGIIRVMRFRAREMPCNRGAACRDANCLRGHCCHRCTGDASPKCKLPAAMHNMNVKVAESVGPEVDSSVFRSGKQGLKDKAVMVGNLIDL
ncbi:hypothetical protein ACN47E_002097 [Coniothyrium glycines]